MNRAELMVGWAKEALARKEKPADVLALAAEQERRGYPVSAKWNVDLARAMEGLQEGAE